MTPVPTRLTLPEALQRAVSAYQSGNADEAESLCALILEADPRHIDAVNLLGALAMRRGDAAAALEHFTRAAQLQPRFAEAHSNRGVALQEMKRWDEALACYRRALEIDPMHVDALYNRGVALSALERRNEALESFDRVLRVRPDYARAWNNRGNLLQELDRWPEALQSYERALQLRPNHPELLMNRGIALLELSRPREALASFERAAALDPQFAEAQWCRSMMLLGLGDYAHGYRLYEWRWKKKDPQPLRDFPVPFWTGEADVRGRTILLHADEGLGDAIHMSRYVPLVEARGAGVILEVYPPLVRILSSLSPTIRMVARDDALPPFDLHCPLGSLPRAFGTTLETIPREPYLHAAPDAVAAWAARLGRRNRPRIGIAWSGNPSHVRDRERSLAFERLSTLLEESVEFHCLQKEIRPADREAIAKDGRLHVWKEELGDFADTAALIANMDVVVSVDTSVAHLAAALGKPTWILLAKISDYRWLLDRTDSPWYPSARLFRQPSRGDWGPVIDEARAALRELASRAA